MAQLATVIDSRLPPCGRPVHLKPPRDHPAADALKAARHQRQPQRPVVFHSDRDSQYTSQAFAALAATHDVPPSAGRTGRRWDNALAESFSATLKNELVSRRRWHNRSVARSAILDYTEGWQHPPTPLQPRPPKPGDYENTPACPTHTTCVRQTRTTSLKGGFG
ncbi:DDE-type integrase/transposase/recombinase [Streptomyces sp. NPDC056254]|uniref:DDE-type integrase/transposase/recombinase n=1 Tax=Streptomyces sp. NPDC056254 TaxID=3345763 RepID=UPI0035E39D61